MRSIAVVHWSLCLAGAATASSALDVTRLPTPAFPSPVGDVTPTGPRLELVSSRYRDPATQPPSTPAAPAWAPKAFRGAALQGGSRRGGRVLLLYGDDGVTVRYVVGANARSHELVYAYDFVEFGHPPGRGEYEPVMWAREAKGVLYVSNTHLTYASQTRGRNAYVSAIDLGTKRTKWRSRALVANSRNFVVSGDLIVAGYGLTREPDYLYLLDRPSGRVLDRLRSRARPR